MLDVAAAVAMIAAAAAILWTTFKSSATATPQRPPTYKVGDPVSVADLGLDHSGRTLLLWLNSGCRYCTASMPFYRSLSAAKRDLKIIVVGTEQADHLEKYVTAHDFRPDRVVSVAPSQLKLTGTPTLLLIDRNQRVLAIWRGQLSANKQQAVLAEFTKDSGN